MKGKKGFLKGQSGNPSGRPVGKSNKITASVREVLAVCISKEIDRLSETIEQLEPRERVDAIVKLLPYIMPKMPEDQIENDTKKERTQFSFMEIVKQQYSTYEGTEFLEEMDTGILSKGEHYLLKDE